MGHLWVAKAHDQDSARSAMAVVRGLGHGGHARCLGEALDFGARGISNPMAATTHHVQAV